MEDQQSTNTSIEEDRNDEFYNATSTSITDGLMTLLGPAVLELDQNIKLTQSSQSDLRTQIDSLNEELTKMAEVAKNPGEDFNGYVTKLINAKRRIMIVNNILQNAQERINRVLQGVERENARRSSLLNTPQAGGATNSGAL